MSVDSYFCFCCLSTQDLTNLFIDDALNYIGLIYNLCGVKPSEDLKDDSYICEECVSKLKDIHSFKNQVKEIVNILQINGLIQLRKIKGELILSKVYNYNLNDSNDDYVKLLKNKNINVTLIPGELKTEKDPIPSSPNKPNNKSEGTIKIIPEEKIKKEKDEEFSPVKKKAVLVRKPLTEADIANQRFDCSVCSASLPNSYVFHRHMNEHFPNNICELCGRGFISKLKLKRHMINHDKGPFKCKHCDAVFTNRNTLSTHIRKKHSAVPPYACPRCALRFPSLTRRVRHLLAAHRQPPDRHRCGLCPSRFPQSSQLRIHMNRVHYRIKRFSCDVCDASYYTKADYEGHLAGHTGEYKYHCEHCGKKYPRKKALVVHLKTHLPEKPYSCERCGKGFTQKHALNLHINARVCLAKIDSLLRDPVGAGPQFSNLSL